MFFGFKFNVFIRISIIFIYILYCVANRAVKNIYITHFTINSRKEKGRKAKVEEDEGCGKRF